MKSGALYAMLICAYVLLLLARIVLLNYAEAGDTLEQFVGEKAVVSGYVVNDPERRATTLHAYIAVEKVGERETQGRLLAILPRDAKVGFGDKLRVSGLVSLPESFETDTGRVFDYQNYLRVRGVSTMMRYATLDTVESGNFSLQKVLYEIKHTFEHSLERLFPEPSNALLEGLLLGERRGLPEELTKAFVTSGLIHVVVLSGYNISIVANAVLYTTSFLPRTLGFGFGGVLMILFVIMTGAGATAVRACIMGLIAILALYLKRPKAALRALIAAALLMILWNPLIVLYDPSFILSVLATFGLITLTPFVEKYLRFVPEYFGLRSIAGSTIAVQLYVLPALLYLTGVLSFVGVPANVLALPVVPLTMLGGFLAGLLGLLHPVLALPFVIFTNTLLEFMIFVAESAEALPFASTVVARFPLPVAYLAYVPLTLFAMYSFRNASQQRSN